MLLKEPSPSEAEAQELGWTFRGSQHLLPSSWTFCGSRQEVLFGGETMSESLLILAPGVDSALSSWEPATARLPHSSQPGLPRREGL